MNNNPRFSSNPRLLPSQNFQNHSNYGINKKSFGSQSSYKNRGQWRGRGRGSFANKWTEYKNRRSGESSQDPSCSQKDIRVMLPPIDCPYKGWHLYMRENFRKELEVVRTLKFIEDYFARNPASLNDLDDKTSVQIDIQNILTDPQIRENVPNLREMISSTPQEVINIIGLAIHQTVSNNLEATLREEAAEDPFLSDVSASHQENADVTILSNSIPVIRPRLTNFDKCIPLKNIKANYYGTFVSVKGTVVRVSSIKPFCTQMAFTCLTCGSLQGIVQIEGKYTVPLSCPSDHCQSHSFVPERCHRLTQTVDFQSIRLQEIVNDEQREGGRVPRVIDCELREDLVDSCIPGDAITVTGIVKVNQNDEARGSKAEKSLFNLYIDVNSVINSKSGGDSTSTVGLEFSIKDYYAIEKIQSEEHLFKLLVASLCPLIYGHELVKAGLILCLFGGCSKDEGFSVPVRGEPHILVVGDPGLGKSQLLQACASVAPRGVYVCGNTTTTAGLTVTLSREAGGDHALEGGALVLADQGVCCIDEFDKMTNQHHALLEAMEQQSISLAKAGIVCSLPARTSILAAANPVGGHYNKAKTVSENIKMSGPLLSRFDLVFILLDKPDEELDSLLSEHVMSLHSGRRKPSEGRAFVAPSPKVRKEDLMNTSATQNTIEKPLSERLKYKNGELVDCIPHQLIRKYICYARKYVKPKLTPAAATVIQLFYLELRQKLQNSDSTPITTRQLESLIRLSEARARCELREEVLESDAKEVVEILKFSMIDTYSDEHGFLDFQRSQHGSGASNRSQMKKFVASLQKLSETTCKSIFSVDEMKQLAKQLNVHTNNFGDFIAQLNHQGFLLKKSARVYQLLTAD